MRIWYMLQKTPHCGVFCLVKIRYNGPMKKQETTLLEKIVTWGTVLALFITPLLYSNNRIASAVTSKQYFFIGIVDLLVVAWVWLMATDIRYRPSRKNLYALIPVGFFALSATVSTLLGGDITTSLFSTIERGGGLVFFIHVVIFATITTSIARVQGTSFFKKTAQAILCSGVLIAIMTFFTREAFDIGVNWLNQSVGGAMLGNSTIAGAYFIFALFMGMILFKEESSKAMRAIYGIAMAIILLSPIYVNVKGLFDGAIAANIAHHPFIVIGQARAAAISLFAGMVIAGLVYIILRSGKKAWVWAAGAGIAAIMGVLLFAGIQVFHDGSAVQRKFIEQVGPNRVIFWEEAAKGIKERPVFGWGPENFKIVHQKFFNPVLADVAHATETWVDKPHNSFIELVVTQGYIGLIAYLFLLAAVIWMVIGLVKKGVIDPARAAILVGMLFAFVLQNQFAFDAMVTVIALFTIIGMIAGLWNQNDVQHTVSPEDVHMKIVAGIVTAIAIPVWVLAAYLPSRKMVQAKKIFDEPVAIRSAKYEKLFSGTGAYGMNTDLGMIFYTLAEAYLAQRVDIQNNPQYIKQAVPELQALIAVGEARKNFAKKDYRFMLAMAIFQETEIGIVGTFSQQQLDRMHEYIDSAIAIAPNNPFSYLVQNKILLYTEQIDEARAAVDKAIQLNPNVREAHQQKIGFESTFGTHRQQIEALEHARKYFPDHQ